MMNNTKEELVDIRDVLAAVDAEKHDSQEDRVSSFLEKIKNPYEYKVGSVIVRVKFANQMTIDDCFANFLATL